MGTALLTSQIITPSQHYAGMAISVESNSWLWVPLLVWNSVPGLLLGAVKKPSAGNKYAQIKIRAQNVSGKPCAKRAYNKLL